MNKIIKKIYQNGLKNSFFLFLISITPRNLNYPYFLFKKYTKGLVVKKINGVKMYLDLLHDDGLSKQVFLNGKRERVTVDYLLNSDVLKVGDTVLDIGGNIGYYALPESRLVGESGMVYAVEPVSSNIELLSKNINLNRFQNIKTHQAAMGEGNGEIPVYVRSMKNLSSLSPLPGDIEGENVTTENVKLITVDSFVSSEMSGKCPDMVRMDVEGHELSIFEGMENCFRTGTTLMVEFHPMFLDASQKDRIHELLTLHKYGRVVVTINPKPLPNFLIKYFNKQIGKKITIIPPYETDIEGLRELLDSSKRVFNAFVFKS